MEPEIENLKAECRSSQTFYIYERSVRTFLQFAEMTPDLLIAKAREDELFVPQLLKRFLHQRGEKEKLSASALRYEFSAVKKFIESNIEEKELPWRIAKKVLKGRAGEAVYANDTCPTKEDAQEILAVMPLKQRTIVGMLFSSGTRVGAVLQLRLKHVDLKTYDDIGIVHVPQELDKVHRGYTTFVSPQVKGWLQSWLREREENGEKLGPESFLFPASERGQETKRYYTHLSFRAQYERYLKRADKWEKARALTDKEIKSPMSKFHLHTWRKYFSTAGSKADARSDYIEAMMGHVQGVKGAYKVFTDDELAAEYRKMIPLLDTETIHEEVDREKLRKEISEDWEQKYGSLARENKELKEKIGKIEDFFKRQTHSNRTPLEEAELMDWLWGQFRRSKRRGEKEAPIDVKLKVAGMNRKAYYGPTIAEEQKDREKLLRKAGKEKAEFKDR